MSKTKEKKLQQLTANEVKAVVSMFLDNNVRLQKDGKLPNAVAFIAEAGIGKTSAIIQVAEERGASISKINLGTLDDLGDLVGFPLKSYKMTKEDKTHWFDDKRYTLMVKQGWSPTGEIRTDYAPPKWVTNLETKENILLLDDFNRADQRFMQAVMDLIDRQEYYGWKLPKGTTIVLTGNPADSDYFTAQQDSAQSTRYFEFGVKFDIKSWAKHAEDEGIDGRCINFLLNYWREVIPVSASTDKLKTNPRQWTKFFNQIGGFNSFENSLPEIQLLGKGIVGDFVNQFTTFINKKLDLLIEPDEMVHGKNWPSVKAEIVKKVGSFDTGDYKPEIASILATRFGNYTIKYLSENPLTDEMAERFEQVCKEKVFGDDLNFKFFRDNFAANKNKFKKMLQRPYFMKHLI